MKQKDFDKSVLDFAIKKLIEQRTNLIGIGNGINVSEISPSFKVHHKEIEASLKRSGVRFNSMGEFIGTKEYEITHEYVKNLKQ